MLGVYRFEPDDLLWGAVGETRPRYIARLRASGLVGSPPQSRLKHADFPYWRCMDGQRMWYFGLKPQVDPHKLNYLWVICCIALLNKFTTDIEYFDDSIAIYLRL